MPVHLDSKPLLRKAEERGSVAGYPCHQTSSAQPAADVTTQVPKADLLMSTAAALHKASGGISFRGHGYARPATGAHIVARTLSLPPPPGRSFSKVAMAVSNRQSTP